MARTGKVRTGSGAGRLAVVGVGRLGRAVAERLVAAGHDVRAFDVRPDVAELLADGVTLTERLGDAISGARLLMTALPGSRELRALMLGEDALLSRLDPGAAWIDLGTTAPDTGDELAAAARVQGRAYLDAPVGGGPDAVRAGSATLYVGGAADVLDEWRPVLGAVAARIEHMGEHGSGYRSKLLINLLWFAQAVAVGEALAVVRRSGLDPHRFADALADSAAASRFVERYLPGLLDGDFAPGFGLHQCVEELDSLVRFAAELRLPAPLTELIARVHHDALDRFGPVDGELLAVAHLWSTLTDNTRDER